MIMMNDVVLSSYFIEKALLFSRTMHDWVLEGHDAAGGRDDSVVLFYHT